MNKFEYAILTLLKDAQGKQSWVVAPKVAAPNPNLLIVLNELGQLGWEAVAIGDLGASAQSEVLLKKRVA